jgi:hypothetical protein
MRYLLWLSGQINVHSQTISTSTISKHLRSDIAGFDFLGSTRSISNAGALNFFFLGSEYLDHGLEELGVT